MSGITHPKRGAEVFGLLRVVLAALPGGERAAGLAMAGLVLADVAVLAGMEGALVSLSGEEGAALRHVVMFTAGGFLAAYESRWLVIAMSNATNIAISNSLRRILQAVDRLDLRGFELIGADRIHRRLTLESPLVAAAGLPLAASIRYIARALAAALYLLFIAPQVAVAAGTLLALVGILRYTSGALAEEGLKRASQSRDRLLETMGSLTRGAAQVLLHRRRGDALIARVKKEVADLSEHLKQTTAAAIQTEAVAGVVLYGLIALVSVGLGALDLDLASRVLLAILFVLRAVNQLVMHWSSVQRASIALGGLQTLEAELRAAVDARPLVQPMAPIEDFATLGMSGVTFTYGRQDDYVFGPVDLTVNRGEILFITGRNGSGKSTALKLLLGLYPPDTGTLQLDGRPVPTPAAQAWRNLFSVVLSEFVLFEQLSGPPVPEPRAQELLDWFALTEKVRIEDGKFSTLDLSTGQRKRLAMVVALLQDRPVFVFDEWAADQDPEFRETYYRRILPDLKERGKTVVCVTHDDQYFHLADRRLVIEAGRVVV